MNLEASRLLIGAGSKRDSASLSSRSLIFSIIVCCSDSSLLFCKQLLLLCKQPKQISLRSFSLGRRLYILKFLFLRYRTCNLFSSRTAKNNFPILFTTDPPLVMMSFWTPVEFRRCSFKRLNFVPFVDLIIRINPFSLVLGSITDS